jgi:hypothetical protein
VHPHEDRRTATADRGGADSGLAATLSTPAYSISFWLGPSGPLPLGKTKRGSSNRMRAVLDVCDLLAVC